MDSSWFKEDRALPISEQNEAIDESKKALKNSTLITRRLSRLIEEKIEKSFTDDEDFSKPNWQYEHVANIAKRKVLLEILKLLDFN